MAIAMDDNQPKPVNPGGQAGGGLAAPPAASGRDTPIGARDAGGFQRAVRLAPSLFEIVLAVGLGLIVISIAYALFGPLPTPRSLPAGAAPVAAAQAPDRLIENPFRQTDIEPAAVVDVGDVFAETSLDLKLHGVIKVGQSEAAIIQTPDGEQSRYGVGDEVWNGVTLDRIDADRVVLLSAGVRETLRIINRSDTTGGFAPAPPQRRETQPASTLRSGNVDDGLSISDIVSITPRATSDGLRLVVSPGANANAFAATGLRPGDQVLAVNNRRLPNDLAAAAQQMAGLADQNSISLLVERDGVAVPIDLELSAGVDEDDVDD